MATNLKKGSITKIDEKNEILRCGSDPVYFFTKYCMIQTKSRRSLFKVFDFQKNCLKIFLNHKHVIVNKSRQLGLSTLVAAYATWLSLFKRDQNILVLATKLETAKNFISKCAFIVQNIPEWMVLADIQCNIQEIVFDHGSKIKAIPTSKDAGRSEALTLLIVDEAAHIEDLDTIWTGLSPTISYSGGSVIMISSPLGTGNLFYEIYKDATENPESEFYPLTLPWDVHPERDQEWYRKEVAKFKGDAKKIAQEYECSFNASGNTFLDALTLEFLKNEIKPPISRGHADRNLWIWKEPAEDHKYILSADAATGEGKDYSAFHVIDQTDQEVVAEYIGKEPPDKFGDLINEVGLQYNKAVVCPENNSYGYPLIYRLKQLRYPRLYNNEGGNIDLWGMPSFTSDMIRTIGINMHRHDRPAILSKMEEIIRNKQIKLYSSRTYNQLMTFILKGNKAEASSGKNDDLVMALAIGIWLYVAEDNSVFNEEMSKSLLKSMAVESVSAGSIMSNPNSIKEDDYNVFVPSVLNSGLASGLPSQNQTKVYKLNKNWSWLYK